MYSRTSSWLLLRVDFLLVIRRRTIIPARIFLGVQLFQDQKKIDGNHHAFVVEFNSYLLMQLKEAQFVLLNSNFHLNVHHMFQQRKTVTIADFEYHWYLNTRQLLDVLPMCIQKSILNASIKK